MNDDARLQDLFRQSRNLEAERAPDFGRLLKRRRARDLARRSAALALLAFAAFLTFSGSEPPPVTVSLTEWRSPTAFLLRTTDEALWRGLPSLGPTYEKEIQ